MAIECAKAKAPSSWCWSPLRRVSDVRREPNTNRQEPLLALSAERGIELRPEDGGRQLASEVTESTYWVVHPNDLVFNPMWALEGGVAVSFLRGAVSPAYRVYELGGELHPPFVHHFMRSRVALEQYRALVRGVTTFDRSVTRDDLDAMPIPVPPIEYQRTIANFLDAETARIDALIAKKQQLMELLGERCSGRIELLIRELAARWGELPLKLFVHHVTVGIVVTPAAWYAEIGVPALRGINVKRGHIDQHDIIHITEEGHALHGKSAVDPGDVVVVRTGQAGVAAVVPSSLAGANCIDLLIIRPGSQVVPLFLEYVLNSDWTQKHVEAHSVGTIQSHFNVAAMKELPIPRAPLGDQHAAVKTLGQLTCQIDKSVRCLGAQIALLQERRQALITAAVTGQLDIPGLAA